MDVINIFMYTHLLFFENFKCRTIKKKPDFSWCLRKEMSVTYHILDD